MSQPNFDTKRFIADNWGSADRLYRWLVGYDVEVQRQQIYKWLQRESIPAEHLPVVLALLEMEKGKPVSLVEWMK